MTRKKEDTSRQVYMTHTHTHTPHLVPSLVSYAVREGFDMNSTIVYVVKAYLVLAARRLQLQVALVAPREGHDGAGVAVLLLQRGHHRELPCAAQQCRCRLLHRLRHPHLPGLACHTHKGKVK